MMQINATRMKNAMKIPISRYSLLDEESPSSSSLSLIEATGLFVTL